MENNRMGHCPVKKQNLDGTHACDELTGNLFCCKYRHHHTWTRTFHTCMGVCCLSMLVWLGSEYRSTRTRHTWMGVCHCGKVSIRIFDLQKVGKGYEEQFLQWCHLMAKYKNLPTSFLTFLNLLIFFTKLILVTQTHTHTHTHAHAHAHAHVHTRTRTQKHKPIGIGKILQICLKM